MKLKFIFILISISFLIPTFAEEVSPGVLRTPDDRFEDLKDYPFDPSYMEIDGLRIHYLDEGPKEADPIFLLHGEPTWSYLFRKMIPVFTAAGHRVIVPDMVGFGKSDKFVSKYDYSYQHHIDVMKELVERLDLNEATFFGQDWGGLVGLRVVAEMPDRFARVVVSNTGMPSRGGFMGWVFGQLMKLRVWWEGPVTLAELKADQQFLRWMAHSYYSDDMDIAAIISIFGELDLSEEEIRAYEAPYPNGQYKAGAHVFPYLIPTQLRENEEYWVNVFEKWKKPFLVAFGGEEKVTIAMKPFFMDRVPTATEVTLEGVGHFCQEEVGPQLAELMNDFIAGRPIKWTTY